MTTALGNGLRRAAARLAPDPAPDGELLARFLSDRDESAFALLVRRHACMVFGTCRRVLGNSADADDAFQAAFVVLVRKAHSLTDRSCVGNFLYGVAFHTALKARAMATKRRVKEAKASRPDRPEPDDLARVLDEELAKLPDKYREPVVLCELDGVSRKEAAGRLGIPEGTVSSRLATAHRMLAKRLTARGFAAAAVAAVLANPASAVPESLSAAAVRAAADGPTGAVSQLACEVSKMLLFNKLRAAAVVAGVLLACMAGVGVMKQAFAEDLKATPPAKADAKKPDDAKLLQGTWVTKAVTFDPPWPVGPGETHTPAHHILTFTGTDLTWVSYTPGALGRRTGQTKPFKLDVTASPKELTSGDNECVYELDGDTLRVAMFALTPGRPKGFTAKDSPPGRGHVWVIELTREKPEKANPASDGGGEKKHEADKSYTLKDGEVLKLIAAPFGDEREEVYTKFDAAGGLKPTPAHDTRLMAVAVKDGKPVSANAFTNRRTPGVDAPGKPLALLLADGLGIDMTKTADPNWLLESTVVDADVVYKKGADPVELMAALQKELKAKCGVELSLKFEEAEREVVVVSGKHTLNPTPKESDDGRVIGKASEVHFVAADKVEHPNSLIGNTRAMPAEIAKWVGRPVVDESDLRTNAVLVKMTFHERYPATDKTRAEDRDAKKVLQELSNQTGLVFKLGKQKVKVLVVEKANPDRKGEGEKKEAVWKAEFRKAYGLKDGELVRRVSPHPACRDDYFKDLFPNRQGNIPVADWFTVFAWKDDWTDAKGFQSSMPVKADVGVPLDRLIDMTLKFPRTRVEGPAELLAKKVTGDFVVKTGADTDKLAAQLETLLAKECDTPVKFSFKEATEDVYVLSGKYAAAPLEGKKADEVEIYAVYRNDGTTGGGGTGTLAELAAAVERHCGHRVMVGDVADAPKAVKWHFNDRVGGSTKQEYDQDHDAPTLLTNVAAQTGLKCELEKRKARVLVVELVEK